MAIADPLESNNNKLGIHILFPSELSIAAKLVNPDSKGDWGYVVIPIQATDRDQIKWQTFLDDAHKYHLIPILRIATYPEGSNWAVPNNFDLIDFANFLNQLNWHLKNRYIIIFNEVNRSDEFGGLVSPEKYAEILREAYHIFKSRSTDFFVLPSALDNAAATTSHSMNHRLYIERMYLHENRIFDYMDGWNSHAYPNPAFSAQPQSSGTNKINSYRSDLRLISQFTNKKLPVFITETGWSSQNLSETTISRYFDYAFKNIWTDANIVTVAPFILSAQDGPFVHFSFLDNGHNIKARGLVFQKYATYGSPRFADPIIATTATVSTDSGYTKPYTGQNFLSVFQSAINMLLNIFK